jgi:hypothetical protein
MLVPEWGDPTIKIGEFVKSEELVIFCLASTWALFSFAIPCLRRIQKLLRPNQGGYKRRHKVGHIQLVNSSAQEREKLFALDESCAELSAFSACAAGLIALGQRRSQKGPANLILPVEECSVAGQVPGEDGRSGSA